MAQHERTVETPFLRIDPDLDADPGSPAAGTSRKQLSFALTGGVLGVVLGVVLATTVAGPISAAIGKNDLVEKPEPFKILFVGNSFTYGPPPAQRKDQMSLNNLPRFFKLIAESLGHPVLQQEDTLGGCSLYAAHRPSIHPESRVCGDSDDCQVVDTGCFPSDPGCTPRVDSSMDCTVARDITIPSHQWAPCPQLFGRQQFGAWDVVVLQDQSALPTVKLARELYMNPAVDEFVQAAKHQGDGVHKKAPIMAAYMAWPYFNGSLYGCPGWSKPGCFPLGELNDLAQCDDNDHYHQTSWAYECQAYANARAYAALFKHGTDVFIPAGIAHIAARGAEHIPANCKAAIDSEYDEPFAFESLGLPLKADPADVRWSGKRAHGLYRDVGHVQMNRQGLPAYCTDGCTHDHHASAISMYLNALVFFTTLFKESPIGAAWPNGQTIDGMLMPIVDPEDAKAMQHIVHDVVLPHLSAWWNGK